MPVQLLDKLYSRTPASILKPGIEDQIVFSSRFGVLYEGDCLQILPYVHDCLTIPYLPIPRSTWQKSMGHVLMIASPMMLI